jgi:rare lipoprotein A
MFRLSQVFWVGLLACVLTVCSGERAEAREVLTSWYGPGFKGLPTASGEPYDPSGYTAAHKRMPFGSQLLVSYGGRSVQVTVNDRGPYVGQRRLDLSKGAAKDLGLKRVGVDYVDYMVVGGRAYDDGYGGYDASHSERASYPRGSDYSAYPQTETYSSGAQLDYGGAYKVQRGDTLAGVAAQLGTTVEYLAATNGIADPDLIYSGQTLYY